MDIVGIAIRNARLTISLMLFLTLAGALAYRSIPKEAEPDVQIPIIYVSMSYSGISPEDSERLLLRPMETRLKTIANVKEMTARAYQGGGNVVVEFQAGSDLDRALEDVRNKVADAKPDLPSGAEEPTVNEVNLSEFPVLVVTLSGDVPERDLTVAARELRDRIEEVPGVLEAALKGVRDDLVEVIIDPMRLSTYGLQLDQVIAGGRRQQQPGRRRLDRGVRGPLRDQDPLADRDRRRRREPADRRRRRTPSSAPATSPRSGRPSRTPRPSPASTASPRSPSRSPSAPAPT